MTLSLLLLVLLLIIKEEEELEDELEEEEYEEEQREELGSISRRPQYSQIRRMAEMITTKLALNGKYRDIFSRRAHWADGILPSDEFIEEQFQMSFRMHRSTLRTLHDLLKPYIRKTTTSGIRIPSDVALLFIYTISHRE